MRDASLGTDKSRGSLLDWKYVALASSNEKDTTTHMIWICHKKTVKDTSRVNSFKYFKYSQIFWLKISENIWCTCSLMPLVPTTGPPAGALSLCFHKIMHCKIIYLHTSTMRKISLRLLKLYFLQFSYDVVKSFELSCLFLCLMLILRTPKQVSFLCVSL